MNTTLQQRSLWATMLSVKHQVKNIAYKAGLFMDYHFGDSELAGFILNPDTFSKNFYNITSNKTMLRYGFYNDFIQQLNQKWSLQYGILIDKYASNETIQEDKQTNKNNASFNFALFPRASFSYAFNPNNTFFYRFGVSRRAMLDLNLDREIPQTNLYSMQWKHLFSEKTILNIEAFYQNTKNVFHLFSEVNPYGITSQNTENQGISTRFEKQFSQNAFIYLNTTWFRSRFKDADSLWRSTRYDSRFASNVVLGKQWQRKRSLVGLNCTIFFNGGQRDTPIDEPSSAANGYTFYQPNAVYTKQLQPYFRSDCRVFRTVKKKRYTATLSLDIQNVTNQQNVNFQYYDPIMQKVVSRYQTGLVPILNYRMEWN
jgi:hypothetical protein